MTWHHGCCFSLISRTVWPLIFTDVEKIIVIKFFLPYRPVLFWGAVLSNGSGGGLCRTVPAWWCWWFQGSFILKQKWITIKLSRLCQYHGVGFSVLPCCCFLHVAKCVWKVSFSYWSDFSILCGFSDAVRIQRRRCVCSKEAVWLFRHLFALIFRRRSICV